MTKEIIITGATGFLGKALFNALKTRGYLITVFSRSLEKAKSETPGAYDYVVWDFNNPDSFKDYVNNKYAVIHLAGANLFGKRWTDDYKKLIMESRRVSTSNLAAAAAAADSKPEVFISASGIGYYGDSGETMLTEKSRPGSDFLAEVCQVWEEEAAKIEKFKVRRVSIRTGVVLSPGEGALKEMLTPFKMFVGGPLGSGMQWFSWIHLEDIINTYIFALENPEVSGPVNAAAPNPVRMKEFADTLGKVMHRPSLFKVPGSVLKIAVGGSAEAVLGSQKVFPQKLLHHGFNFKFESLEPALRDLLK